MAINREHRLNICILIFVILSLVITGYIFYNSFQKPEVSNKKSGVISNKIQSIVDPQKKISDKNFRKYTRKAAHVIEFAALGVSLCNLFICIYKKNKRIYVSMPLILGVSVAILDEFIQSFNNRSSKVSDILIDFGGLLTGLFFVLIFASILYGKNKNT